MKYASCLPVSICITDWYTIECSVAVLIFAELNIELAEHTDELINKASYLTIIEELHVICLPLLIAQCSVVVSEER